MKKGLLCFLLFAVVALAGCRKYPDTDDMDHEYIVETGYDSGTSFSAFETYYVPDSVLLITDKPDAEYWKDADAMRLVNAVVADLDARGYTRVEDKEEADLGVQLSYVESTYYFFSYPGDYWWWGYPGYWGPGYWGSWGGWYYPYPVRYAYTQDALLMDAVDLNSPAGRDDSRLKVVWNAYITGFQSRNTNYNLERGVRAINQAFAQSPYFARNASNQ